jgi:hypothetical protein
MFGFSCCADAGATATIPTASDASRPSQMFLFVFIVDPSVGGFSCICPLLVARIAGQKDPVEISI